MKNFNELGLSPKMLKVLEEMKFQSPTEIQEKTIPLALEGKDIIGSSATGSGKTLAFSLGIIEKVEKNNGPQVLILTPTRELADQITKVLKFVTSSYGLRVLEIYGGVSMSPQIENARKSEIIVGTPGRILDHLERKTLNLERLKVLILDEADRMSDMGFLPDVERIIKACPKDRQTMLFSATISGDVNHIAKRHMINPTSIEVESYVDPSKLQQVYYDVPRNMKFSLIVHLLRQEKSKLIMIFCNTRMNADMLARNLKRYGFDAMAIHGGLTQSRRTRLMDEFHGGDIHILVCTDVAARGLDVKGISHVYNYDLPNKPEDYVHRIGRTARAGKEGMAVSIVSNNDYENFSNILRNDELKIEKRELPQVEQLQPNFKRENEINRQESSRGNYRGFRGRENRGRFRGSRGFSRGGRSFGNREGNDSNEGRDRPRNSEFSRNRDSRSRGFSRRRSFGRRF